MAKRIMKKPNIDLEVKKGIAWAVHAFTTCGLVAGFLALVLFMITINDKPFYGYASIPSTPYQTILDNVIDRSK